MKRIRYIYAHGGHTMEMPWSEENEAIAARESIDGEYTIEEMEGTEGKPTQDERITALEQALTAIEEGIASV